MQIAAYRQKTASSQVFNERDFCRLRDEIQSHQFSRGDFCLPAAEDNHSRNVPQLACKATDVRTVLNFRVCGFGPSSSASLILHCRPCVCNSDGISFERFMSEAKGEEREELLEISAGFAGGRIPRVFLVLTWARKNECIGITRALREVRLHEI
jgi:hypothetical protein